MMYFMITAVVTVTSVINLKKIYETHEMLYRLEHWDELDDNEKEAMETLKFIGKSRIRILQGFFSVRNLLIIIF